MKNEDYEEGRWFQYVPCEGFTHFSRLTRDGDFVFHDSQRSAEGWVKSHLMDMKESREPVEDGEIWVGQVLKVSTNVKKDLWNHVEMLAPGKPG